MTHIFSLLLTSLMPFITPAPLQPGDKIAIVSPSGPVTPDYVRKAVPVLREQGWEVEVSPHALGRHGNYSGTEEQRYDDLSAALLDPEVKAVLCARGGYGAVHILDRLDSLPLRENPKWVIGFSDITALHALMSRHGIESVHASMASHLATTKGEDDDSRALFDILSGRGVEYHFPHDVLNHEGEASGRLVGGNLAVFADLIATPYDFFGGDGNDDIILFMEDVAEPVYKVERIMYQLKMMGVLDRVKGLVIGQFTDYKEEGNEKMERMIARMTEGLDIPIAFNAPIGHVKHNIPLVEGRLTTLSVTPEATKICQ